MFSERKKLLISIIQCPTCGNELNHSDSGSKCSNCEQEIGWLEDAVVLYSKELPKDFYNPEYVSSNGYSLRSLALIEKNSSGLVLDLGAGLAAKDFPNVVQLEIRKYRGTDVVTTSDCLPFKDNSFDGVISQAVIEHVRDPRLHVNEINRVLKIGGQVVLDAAFLQPLHGAPYHYFNTTSYAVELLFSNFEIETLEVAPYHHPWYSLRWYLRSYRAGLLTDDDRKEFDNMTIAEFERRFQAVEKARLDFRSGNRLDLRKLAEWGQAINETNADSLGCLVKLTKKAEVELAAGYRVIAKKKANEEKSIDSDTTSKKQSEYEEIAVEVQKLSQVDCDSHTGELCGDVSVVQQIAVKGDICRIEVMFATYMRKNTEDVFLEIYDVEDRHPLVTQSVNASVLEDNQFYTFQFNPINNRISDDLYIKLSSPKSTPENCITVRASSGKVLENGQLYVNGSPQVQDMTIRASVEVRIKRPKNLV